MDLMEAHQEKGHCLFIDNFYTSPHLLLDLLAHGTYSIGTFYTSPHLLLDLLARGTYSIGTV